MFTGIVESIHIASDAEKPTQAVAAVAAIPGVGLEGDRYALKKGTFYKPQPDYELTLIEAEAIEALRREYSVELAADMIIISSPSFRAATCGLRST